MQILHPKQTVPQPEAETYHANNQPEWARIPDIIRVFGIKRTRLFALLAEGQIKSVNLRRRNCVRGVRLINCDSVRALLETLANKEGK